MTSRRYKKLKKEIKQKIKKIKDYEISDNKLAALVFIVSIVLGIRAGNYIRLFVFEHETKKKKKRKISRIFESILRTRIARLGSRTSLLMMNQREMMTLGLVGAYDVSLFGKNKNKNLKK